MAASNTYLESAVHDLLGDQVPVMRLAEAGMCPGHFDIRPSQIEALRNCQLLLRFDFQQSLDQKLANVAGGGLRIAPVKIVGGMCEPASYLDACRQVANALVESGMLDRGRAAERLAAVESRLTNETAWAQRRITDAKLTGRPVVTSQHQAAFSEFLGLKVVARFSGADTARINEINEVVRNGTTARVVIANLPEGRGLADALGRRLGAPVVVFGNFPDEINHRGRFDELFRDNIQRLIDAVSE